MSISEEQPRRPKFSVMIPTYEPTDLLLQMLESVLQQVNDSSLFQIAIVDDASPSVDVTRMVAPYLQRHPIEVYRHETNIRLAGNWNRAISLARGELVHILHQDDLVKPGFYTNMSAAFDSHPAIGMAFCRHQYIDEAGTVDKTSRLERRSNGVLSDWLARITEKSRFQCAAAVVRRSVYESIGTYRHDLVYALDWEMWVRIAIHYPVWFETKIMACYRRHANSETIRLSQDNRQVDDMMHAISAFRELLTKSNKQQLVAKTYLQFARSLLRRIQKLFNSGLEDQARRLLKPVSTALDESRNLRPSIACRMRGFLLRKRLSRYYSHS